jgi:PAS domain S-box-containing protein
VVGLLVLAGWLLDIPSLKSLLPGLATMKPNTALTFVLAGGSLWLSSSWGEDRRVEVLAKACATLTALIGLLTLNEYVFGRNLGIDQLLFRDALTPENAHPGRMSLVSALNFSLLGLALLLPARRTYRRFAEVFSITVLLISMLAFLGYAYGVSSLYRFSPYSTIAIHTALAFTILSLGILFAHTDQGMMRIFSSDGLGGWIARRLTPAALVVPFVLGWLFLTGQRLGLYDSTLRLVLSSISTVIIFAILILWNAGLLQRADEVRQQAQTQLSRSEERKATILETSLDGIITIDHKGRVLEFNPAAQKIFGYAEAEALGKEMGQLIIPPSLREQHRSGLAKYLAIGEGSVLGKRIEMTGMRADGTEFPVELSITRDPSGELPIFTGFVRDITQRKRAEQILRESEERFRLVVQAAPSAMVAADRDGKISLANVRAQELFGYREEELLGRPVEMLVPERFRSGHGGHRQSFLEKPVSRPMGAGRDLFGLHKDGHEFPIEIGLTPYESPQGPFTLTVIVDITERKQAREKIAYQAYLLENINDAIIGADQNSVLTFWNRAAERTFGWKAEEVLGHPGPEILRSEPLNTDQQTVLKTLAEQDRWNGESILFRRDGTQVVMEASTIALRDARGLLTGYVSVFRDITERKKAEEEVRRFNEELEERVAKRTVELEAANKELEAFSYSVSHDLRTPLRGVDGYSRALLQDYGELLPPEGHDFLEHIRSSAQRMSAIIDDLLNLARVTRVPIKSVPVDLSQLAQGIAAELQRSQPERRVKFMITPNVRTRGDSGLLQDVLENLLNNAWKFTANREQAEIEFGSKLENGEVLFFVRDNGAGFDMAYAGKLFGAFQRLHAMTEFSGTGIGLATVQRIISRHGGRIWAEGAVDQGATFYFTFPALDRTRPVAVPKKQESLVERVKEII